MSGDEQEKHFCVCIKYSVRFFFVVFFFLQVSRKYVVNYN